MELEDLMIAKSIIAEMIKSKKSHIKAIDRMYNCDPYGSSRANTTTMNANISKCAKTLEDYKVHLEEVVKRL